MKVKDLIENLSKYDGEAIIGFAYKTSICTSRLVETDPRALPCLEEIQPHNKDGAPADRKIAVIHINDVAIQIKQEIIDRQLAALAERIVGLVKV